MHLQLTVVAEKEVKGAVYDLIPFGCPPQAANGQGAGGLGTGAQAGGSGAAAVAGLAGGTGSSSTAAGGGRLLSSCNNKVQLHR